MPDPRCPVCRSTQTTTVYGPIVLPSGRYAFGAAANALPKHAVHIHRCGTCRHGFNVAFQDDYVDYARAPVSESRPFATNMNQTLEAQARRLVQRWGVRGVRVLEVACGDGAFLSRLLEHNEGLGIDPGADARAAAAQALPVRAHAYDPEHPLADGPFDAVVARQFLEHVGDPLAYLSAFARTLEASTLARVYIEVPNGGRSLDRGRFADLYPDHPGHFCAQSLCAAIERAGFELETLELPRDGELLAAVARVRRLPKRSPEDERLAWSEALRRWHREGRKVALWGVTGAGTTFVHATGLADTIALAVDGDPNKQGQLIPGTSILVQSPTALQGAAADILLICSQLHAPDIRAQALERLDPPPTCFVVGLDPPPKDETPAQPDAPGRS